MRRILRAKLLASVLAVGIVSTAAVSIPAYAQAQWSIGFDSFHDQLAQYGDWVYSDRWGLVWQPADVPDDFRPYYSGGHWAYTDAYGWTWASDYEWGDIAFHYGRWVDDPYDGWMWIPGYSWSPGWVIWRSNQQSVGWMPMPPDDDFLLGRSGVSIRVSLGGWTTRWSDTSDNYGYSRWYGRDYDQRRFALSWTFVDTGHMADRDYRHVAYAPDRTNISIRQTTNITNYTVVNNYIVNRSVDLHMVERASGHPVAPVAAAMIFKHPSTVVTVDASQKIHAREFDRAPRGSGIANSAPPPPPAVINKLSDHMAAHHAGGTVGMRPMSGSERSSSAPSHLFTRATITAPAATNQFHGRLPAGPSGAMPGSTSLVPSGPAKQPAVPASAAPLPPKALPGAMTGPGNAPAALTPGAKMHEERPGGPGTATRAPAGRSERVLPQEQMVKPSPTERIVKPTAEPAMKPLEHPAMRPEAPPIKKPVTEPMVKPLERQLAQPVRPPVVKPVEHKGMQPAHNPPPVVESRKPAPKAADEPKQDEHKNKGEQRPPN